MESQTTSDPPVEFQAPLQKRPPFLEAFSLQPSTRDLGIRTPREQSRTKTGSTPEMFVTSSLSRRSVGAHARGVAPARAERGRLGSGGGGGFAVGGARFSLAWHGSSDVNTCDTDICVWKKEKAKSKELQFDEKNKRTLPECG